MITLIIGLSLSFIAIGVLYYLNNELKKKLENNNRALLALQKEFTQYQVNEKRYWEKERAKEERKKKIQADIQAEKEWNNLETEENADEKDNDGDSDSSSDTN